MIDKQVQKLSFGSSAVKVHMSEICLGVLRGRDFPPRSNKQRSLCQDTRRAWLGQLLRPRDLDFSAYSKRLPSDVEDFVEPGQNGTIQACPLKPVPTAPRNEHDEASP